MLIVTEQDDIVASNRAVSTVLGYEQPELVGRHITFLMKLDTAQMVPCSFRALLLEAGSSRIPNTGTEVIMQRKDGTSIEMEISVSAAECDGRPVFVCNFRDLALRRNTERVQALVQARTEFIAAVSHEVCVIVLMYQSCRFFAADVSFILKMRAPLNAVVSVTRLLADTPLTDEQRELVRTVRSGGDSLLVFINDFLDLSRLEAKKMRLERVEFDLHEVGHFCGYFYPGSLTW
jgi:PAS domain S-box-containing protein